MKYKIRRFDDDLRIFNLVRKRKKRGALSSVRRLTIQYRKFKIHYFLRLNDVFRFGSDFDFDFD